MGSEPQRSPAVLAHPKAPPSHQHPMGSALRHGRHPNGGPPPNRCSPSAQTGVPWQHPPPPDPISTQMGSEPNRGPQCNAVRMGSASKGVPLTPPTPPIRTHRGSAPQKGPAAPPPLRAPPPHRGPPGPAPPVRRPRKQRLCGARRRRRFPVPVRGRTARPAPPAASRVPRAPGAPGQQRRDTSVPDREGGGGGGKRHRGAQRYRKEPLPQRPEPGPKAAAPRPVPTAGTAPRAALPPRPPPPPPMPTPGADAPPHPKPRTHLRPRTAPLLRGHPPHRAPHRRSRSARTAPHRPPPGSSPGRSRSRP